MTEYAESKRTIQRVFAVNAGDALVTRLDAFESEAPVGNERILRTLGAKVITLTDDIDRGEFSTGEGLKLKSYERSLQNVAPPHHLDLDPDRKVGAMQLKEGALLRIFLDLNITDEPIVNAGPLFDGKERIALHYFIPRLRLLGGEAFKNAARELDVSIKDKQSYVLRPRVIEPNRHNWPKSFELLTPPQTDQRAA